MRACRINSAWLILQRVTRSENSAYSSSVKRVLITRWRWGVLYLFMAFSSFLFMVCPLTNRRKTGGKAEVFFEKSENIFSGIFQAAQAAKRRAWGGNPNKIPAGQIEPIGEIWYCGRILLLKSGGFLCVGFPLIPSTERAGLLPTLRQNLPLYYLLRTEMKIRQCFAKFLFVFS